MAVSKRTRFEVLRRDNYTCRYCRSTESELTIDHVTPLALGGTDDPANLVACCKDCNSGKTSTSPDEGTVAQVADDAMRWAAAMAKAAEIDEAKAAVTASIIEWFEDVWATFTPSWADLPADFDVSILQFRAIGLPATAVEEAVRITGSKRDVSQRQMWRYFCGICWNKVRELQQVAADILAAEGGDGG